MALAIMTLFVIHNTGLSNAEYFALKDVNGIETPHYQALMMIALTFSGLVMLYRVCQPFNVTRSVTFITAVACCLLFITVPSLGEMIFKVQYDGALVHLSDLQFSLDQVLLIIIIVQASFPVSGFLIRFFDMINPADE
jgi:hypothetical protein